MLVCVCGIELGGGALCFVVHSPGFSFTRGTWAGGSTYVWATIFFFCCRCRKYVCLYVNLVKFSKVEVMSVLFIRKGNVNRNGHLECGEEMLVFCEHYKLCTEETSQVVATAAANCFGDSSAGPKRHSRSKFEIRIGKMLFWIAQYG